jgi:hypothetical protein
MKKLNFLITLIVVLISQNCFSQNNEEELDDEYKESKFQGEEEPQASSIETYKLSSYSLGKQDINLNSKVDCLKVDYRNKSIIIKYKDKLKNYSFQMDSDETYWSQLSQYTRISGYLWNKTEKHKFYVEAMGSGSIGFYILLETKQGTKSMWFFGDM